jgi:sortase A
LGHLPEARADRALVVATLTAVIVVGGSTLAIVRSTPNVARASEDAPTLDHQAAVTTTTLPPTSTTVAAAAAPRTTPIEPPADPHAAVPVVKIGEIQIPRIGLVHPIYEGVTLTVIDQGPGHWPGSAVPGQLGNAVFAGHRVTHTHPFLRINELVPGDDIVFKMGNGTFTYKVTGHQIVTPKDVHIVDPTPDATLTLFACHPPHQAIQRYVIRAAFVSSTPV